MERTYGRFDGDDATKGGDVGGCCIGIGGSFGVMGYWEIGMLCDGVFGNGNLLPHLG